jgi:hypothetical protein
MTTEIRTGDRIKFRVTVRDGTKTASRFVTGFFQGEPTVRYWGYRDFVVRHDEIISVTPVNPRPSWV